MRSLMFLFSTILISIGSVHSSSPKIDGGMPWKMTVIPMLASLLSPEDSVALLNQVRTSFASSRIFQVMPEEEMMRLLRDAQFQDLRECTYSHCLSDLGKVVGVDRVAQTLFTRRGKLYTFRLRIINTKDAEILFDEATEYSGEFQPFLTTVVPDLVRKTTEAKLESSTSIYKWYYIGAAVIGFGAAIYFINKTLGHGGSPGDNVPPPDRD